MKKTMNDFYEDGSNHEYCPKCGYCITCQDCESFGCGNKKESQNEWENASNSYNQNQPLEKKE